jgi:bleomycin hydrolase
MQAGLHAVEIVGADLTPEGRVIKFKIKNSWGDERGDKGFFHMYQDYFRHFAQEVYFR